MSDLTVILIGTVHYTDYEIQVFEKLNSIVSDQKYKNFFWLCEGESGNRQCISLKDYNIHLLSDALFVNMMLIDIIQINSDMMNSFTDLLYDRILELMITISNSHFKNFIIDGNEIFSNCMNFIDGKSSIDVFNNIDSILKCLKEIPLNDLISNLKITIKKIIDIITSNNMIDNKYNKCINDFFTTGHICENEIMVLLREKSFIHKILLFTFSVLFLRKNNSKIIVTIGKDHVLPLYDLLSKIIGKVRYIILDENGNYQIR